LSYHLILSLFEFVERTSYPLKKRGWKRGAHFSYILEMAQAQGWQIRHFRSALAMKKRVWPL